MADGSETIGSIGDAHSEVQRTASRPASREFAAGLPTLLAASLGAGVGLIGLSVYSLPFFAASIAAEFGGAPTDVTAAASFLVLVLVVMGPLAGRLADRRSASSIAIISAAGYTLGLVAISQFVSSIWQFYLSFALLAVVGAGTGYAVYARVVSSWFEKMRGLGLGIMMSGPGLSAAILPFLLPPVIEHHGWRMGYLALAGLSFLFIPVGLLFLRQGTASVPTTTATGEKAATGLTLSEAVRTRQFWAIILGALMVASTVIGTHLNLTNLLKEKAVGEDTVKITYSVFGIATIAGRILIGALVDRVHGGKVGFGLFLFTALSMLLFHYAASPALLICAGAALGIASGAEGDLCAYLSSRYFGMKAYAEIYGWVFSAIALGLATGLMLAKFSVRMSGSFDLWLSCAALACVLAAFLFATLGPYRFFGGTAEA